MSARDQVTARLCLVCTLAGLPPLAWREMTAADFLEAVRRRARS